MIFPLKSGSNKSSLMLIAGFDPGSLFFGLAVVERNADGDIFFCHAETVKLGRAPFMKRMDLLWRELFRLHDRFRLDGVAVEEAFLGKNVHALSVLAATRGVALASLLERKIEAFFYSPREVKLALTGNGNAGKEQVAFMVKNLLRIDRNLAPDESDALAVACCHALRIK